MKESILIVEDQFVEADYLSSMLVEAGYKVCGIARSYTSALEMVAAGRPDFVLLDIFLKGRHTGIDLARELAKQQIPFVYLSANSSQDVLAAAKVTQPYGFLVKPFRKMDLLAALEIAQFRHRQSVEYKARQARELFDDLARLNIEKLGVTDRLLRLAALIQRSIPFDFMALRGRGVLRIGYEEYQVIGEQELQVISRLSLHEIASRPYSDVVAACFGMQSVLSLPSGSGDLLLFSRRADAYNVEHVGLFERISAELLRGIDPGNRVAGSAEVFADDRFSRVLGTIVGKSHLMLSVFDLISQVAGSDTSVLILGESGTGKERVADCVHQLSRRSEGPFVKVNCAALPASLIESELFGHEKGAFTGALERRIGKFEKAHKGTIFLDEIGELPVELQVKLLRVLQEKEIERVGGKDPIKLDVRIIAATNKNLEKEVAEGRFRLDMYYRLSVFPINLPSLRDRVSDIPLLVEHFIRVYNQKTGKRIVGVADAMMKEMMQYSWPGNIRELEHLIERGVLLAKGVSIENVLLPTMGMKGAMLDASSGDVSGRNGDWRDGAGGRDGAGRDLSGGRDGAGRNLSGGRDGYARLKTMDENERDHILAVLRQCKGRIWGAGAAAEILNLPPSTLKSRMKKLGIKKEYL